MKGSPKPVTDKSFRRKMMLKQKKEMRVNSRLKRGNETCKKFFFICPDVLKGKSGKKQSVKCFLPMPEVKFSPC